MRFFSGILRLVFFFVAVFSVSVLWSLNERSIEQKQVVMHIVLFFTREMELACTFSVPYLCFLFTWFREPLNHWGVL